MSNNRKLVLTSPKCLIPFVSVLLKKDLCIFEVMFRVHHETGEDQVRGLRKLSILHWLGLQKVLKKMMEEIWNCW